MTTDTPRTDAVVRTSSEAWEGDYEDAMINAIALCRTLERELAAANEKIRRLEHEMDCQNGDADYGN